MTALVITVAGQRVSFVVDTNGNYSDVRIQSLGGGPVERLDAAFIGPVLDRAIRERIFKHFSHAHRRR